MRKWQDVKLEDKLRDEVECVNCKVDVHTFFGDTDPTISYICTHHKNINCRCAYYNNIWACPIINDIKSSTETISTYKMILNKFEADIAREENKYPLTDREKIFTNTIIEILKCLDISIR